ncbi:hypothetical protein HGA88_04925 [Candidatus Roizmanbacteria bacterium]|nr:hypothetical protein [Candidatus Roizmanbacteria bacterium]
MIPIILLAQTKEAANEYIQQFTKEQSFSPFTTISLTPEKTEYTIEQIRTIKTELIVVSPTPRLYILHDFDHSSLEAQNAFLKTLEERKNTQFILVVSLLDRLIPTIQSRCRVVKLDRQSAVPREGMNTVVDAVLTSETMAFLSDPLILGINREDALLFLDEVVQILGKKIDRVGTTTVLRDALHTKKLLQNNNLNPQLAIDRFLIAANRTMKSSL